VRLDLNTLPFLNEAAVERAFQTARLSDFARYPEPGLPRLTEALARRVGLPPECVLVGNGSDEVLDLAFRALVPPGGSVGVISPSFGMFQHFAQACRVELRPVAAREKLPVDVLSTLRVDAYFLPSPNNPTGIAFAREDIEALIESTEAPLVLDEAYAEFARQDFRCLARPEGRVLVTRTFSKAYGLPGIRVGYALGPRDLIDRMHRIRIPYNVSSWSERAALAALDDETFVEKAVAFVEAQRSKLFGSLRAAGWPVWPSRANFLFVGPLDRAAEIHKALLAQGVVVKFVDYPGGNGGGSLRITVGTDTDHARLLEALDEVRAWLA